MPMSRTCSYPVNGKNEELVDLKPQNTRSSIKNENHNYDYQSILNQFNKQ